MCTTGSRITASSAPTRSISPPATGTSFPTPTCCASRTSPTTRWGTDATWARSSRTATASPRSTATRSPTTPTVTWSPRPAGITQTLSWNTRGQLGSTVRHDTTTSFGYDGFGRRVRKTVTRPASPGVEQILSDIRYLWDGDDLVMELDAAGNPLRE